MQVRVVVMTEQMQLTHCHRASLLHWPTDCPLDCPTCRVAESAEVAAAKEAKMNPYQLEWKEHGSLLYLVSRHGRLAFEWAAAGQSLIRSHSHLEC